MAKILALGAYFYQAALAFGLLIGVAHLLPPEDFATYSLFISATQFLAIALFEWIRFACSRFYPGPDTRSEASQRKALLIEAGLCCGACILVGLGAMAFGLPAWLALAGCAVAIFQGGSDLQLTMLRFRQVFSRFSVLQGARASLLALGTLLGAGLGQDFMAAALGLVGGYLAYGLLVLVLDRGFGPGSAPFEKALARQHMVYGTVAAGTSVLGLLAPLVLKVIVTSSLGAGAAAGVLLALDLLQRPFVLIVSALQSIQYPDIVRAHDDGVPPRTMAHKLGVYYAILSTLSLVSAGGVIALLWPIAQWLVAPDLRAGFLVSAVPVLGFSVVRALTHTMSLTPAHLRQDLAWLIGLALADCILFNLLAWLFAAAFGPSPEAIIGGAVLGAGLVGLAGLKIIASLPFELPHLPVIIGAGTIPVSLVLVNLPGTMPLVQSLVAAVVAGGLGLLALWLLARSARGTPASSPVLQET